MANWQAIFIEAGHGRALGGLVADSGAVGRFGGKIYKERDFAVEIGRRVIDILRTKKAELGEGCLIQGVGVETDSDIRKKMKFVNTVVSENRFDKTKCLGIAIHMNSSASEQPHGFEVWHQKGAITGKLNFAEAIVRSWQEYKILPLRPKPVNNSANGRFKRFYIDDVSIPYLIIETAFISNFTDMETIRTNFDRVAEALAHGIMEFIRQH